MAAAILLGLSIGAAAFLNGDSLEVTNAESQLTVWHYLFVGALFTGFLATTRRDAVYRKYVILAFLIVISISLSFFVLGLNLFALRYFVYLEWLYGVLFGAMLSEALDGSLGAGALTRAAVFALAAAVLLWRVHGAPWNYGDGDLLT